VKFNILNIKGFRVQILPNEHQQKEIIKFCNVARYAYNWAIATEEENYKNDGKFISGYDLTKLFTQFKKQEENKWLKEISGRALKVAILNAAVAYERFFKKISGKPKFKSKKRSKIKCATHEGTIIITSDKVRLEKLGWIKLAQKNRIPIGDNIKYLNPKIEYDKINFWFSFGIEIINNLYNHKPKKDAIGIDLGIKTLATCSNGIINKKPDITKLKKKLKRLQRRTSKHYQKMLEKSKQMKIKFVQLYKSKNLLKLEKEIKKLHIKIKNILDTNIHMFTTSLIKLNPETIVIEDLNISGMIKNKHISRAINEAKFYEIRRQLTYKCQWNNIKLIIADRWFPSSKLCSGCGYKKDKLNLNERKYICEECGIVIDRDLNASINLKKLAYAT